MPNLFCNIVHNYVLFSVIYVVVHGIPMPPTITSEPDPEVIFDPRVNIELICQGKGSPAPVYTWTKDGRFYEPSAQNNRVAMASDSGTLIFTQAQSIDQGWYQCNATNQYGTAVSKKVRVRLAELGGFPITGDRPNIITVERGRSAILPCQPPTGVPDPETYWTDNSNVGDQFGFIVSNARIQQDYYGRLYFLNVLDEDEQRQYICNVFSKKLNVIRRGQLTQIKVIKTDASLWKPKRLWSSEANKVFLRGYKMTLKCIFGGLPTPQVIWRKLNATGSGFSDRRSSLTMEKLELTISDLTFEDAGVYECRGVNELGAEVFSINVRIESQPYWKVKPKDVHVTEGETVEFVCDAEAKPPPGPVQWFRNGVPLLDPTVLRNPRRKVIKNRLVIQNVTKLDTAVYQCNVTNIHGYQFANFFVNVISEPPEIQKGPQPLLRVVEGADVTLECETFGAPTPKVYWYKRDQVITGGRYAILEDGSLLIREASASDSGIYTCNATNKYGFDSSSGTLNVKRKTRIQTSPGSQEVRRGYYAIFRCTAIADASLTYDIDWYKDGRLLAYTGRFIKDTADQNTLKIVDVQFDDGGSYICRASTELDSDDASATLVVQDRPNRPRITRVNCSGTTQNSFGQPFAIVNWEATGDNNARILYYELQYNTTFTQNDWISVPIELRRESYNEIRSEDGSIKLEPKISIIRTTHLPSNQNDIRVSLSCWANYTFRVIAYNRVGTSDPSPISEAMCTTTTCRPQRNPIGVKAYTTQFSFLTIEWDAMPEIKWNSPKFWYEVGWRRLDQQPLGPFITLRINPPQHILVVPDVVRNVRYQYYVKAYNQQPGETNGGDANEPVTYYTAFSGDSAPSYIPRNFRVIKVFDETTVQFAWDPPILIDESNIRGILKGYQIEVFRLDDPDNSLRVIKNIPANSTLATIFNAPPNADVLARIRIETDRYLGPTSPTVQFPTPEGRPGPVTNLRAVPYSGNGIYLFWDAPDEPNGHIEGYQIDYKTIESIVAQPGADFPSIDIRDEFRRNYLLGGLKPNTKYRIQLKARTSRGLSLSPAIIEITTNESLVPSKPSFVISAVGNTFFNISFNPDMMAVPGSVFFARYKENDKDGQAIYKKTYDVTNERTIMVSPLDPGREYVVFLVASDGIRSEVESDRKYIRTRGVDPGTNVTKSAWFIGTIVSIVVLIIILAVVCGVMRKRGGKYSVQDKETLHGHEYGQDDGKFSEYYRAPSDASIKKSTASLHDGLQDDDRDSMAEFGDGQDRQSRFAEDGSFIGQYGRDDKRRTYLVKYDESNGEQQPYSTSV